MSWEDSGFNPSNWSIFQEDSLRGFNPSNWSIFQKDTVTTETLIQALSSSEYMEYYNSKIHILQTMTAAVKSKKE